MKQIKFPAFNHIVADPAICDGQPRIEGTRITVASILSYIAGGMTVERILDEYPKLSAEDIFQALSFAAANFQDRYIPLRMSESI